jgi:hypothetical protein
MDRLINPGETLLGVINCDWCNWYEIGSLRADHNLPRPAFAGFTPTYRAPDLVLKKKILEQEGEELAVAGFLKYYIAGGARITSEDQNIGWSKQENQPPIVLHEANSPDRDEQLRRGAQFLDKVKGAVLNGQISMADVVAALATPEASKLAILFGFFQDQNCDWGYDADFEPVGWASHNQAVQGKAMLRKVIDGKVTGVSTSFEMNGRPWRDQVVMPPTAQMTELNQELAAPLEATTFFDVTIMKSGQPIIEALPLTLRYEFAAPFEKYGNTSTLLTTGGQIPLAFPPEIYLTRLIISAGDGKVPVLAISSTDYWQARADQVEPSSVVAKLTLDLDHLKPITVEPLPKDLVVPAATDAISFMAYATANPKTTPLVPVQPAPAGTIPTATRAADQTSETTASSEETSPTSETSGPLALVVAGTTLPVTLTGFTAPQTVTVLLDDVKIAESPILTNTAEVAVLIPDSTTTGDHTLTLVGETGERVELTLPIAGQTVSVPGTPWGSLAIISFLILGLAALFLRQRRQAALLILISLSLSPLNQTPLAAAEDPTTPSVSPYADRKAGFFQLVPPVTLPGQPDLYLLTNFSNQAKNFFGTVTTVCFAERLAANWQSQTAETAYPQTLLFTALEEHTGTKDKLFNEGRTITIRSVDQADSQINRLSSTEEDRGNYNPTLADLLMATIDQTWREVAPGKNYLPAVGFYGPPDTVTREPKQPRDRGSPASGGTGNEARKTYAFQDVWQIDLRPYEPKGEIIATRAKADIGKAAIGYCTRLGHDDTRNPCASFTDAMTAGITGKEYTNAAWAPNHWREMDGKFYRDAEYIVAGEFAPGDEVFFTNNDSTPTTGGVASRDEDPPGYRQGDQVPLHVGIYIGKYDGLDQNGQTVHLAQAVIHAQSTGVAIQEMNTIGTSKNYFVLGAKRYHGPPGPITTPPCTSSC